MSSLNQVVHINTGRSYLFTIDNYFPDDYATRLYEKVDTLDLIVEPQMRMGTAHRCMGCYSDVSKGYYFSAQLMESKPMPDFLHEYNNIINKSLNAKFNGLLINKYRGGEDNLGAHSDREKELYNGMVVGYTLMDKEGTRKFRIRDHSSDKIVIDIQLKHNQLYVMGGDFQKEFKHEVPAEKKNKHGGRTSITSRYHFEDLIK